MTLSSSRRTLCLAALLAGLWCHSAAAQVQVNQFFNDTVIQDIWLSVDPTDWATLLRNYTDNTYYHATFNWDGIVQEIGIRQHGGGSRSPIKPNLDLNFAKYNKKQTLVGQSLIIIKANNEDASNLHEWIAMKLYRKMGFPAPRESFATVHVNGQVAGFYLLVEHVDLTFVQRNFGENGGYLYGWQNQGDNYALGNLGTDPSVYAKYLDMKSNQSTPDLTTFVNFIQTINQTSTDADYISAVSRYIDPKLFLTYAAVENALTESDGLVGGFDGVNNFFLYQLQGTTHYEVVPWDQDMSFSTWDRDIMLGFTTGPNINTLAQRLIALAGYKNAYLGQVMKAANLMGGPGGWAEQEINREYDLIKDAASNLDPNKQCMINGLLFPCGAGDFQSGVDWLHSFLALRSDFVLSAVLAAGYQPAMNDPNITSVSIATPGGMPGTSPGALARLSGTNLGSNVSAGSTPLPRNLGNTFVAVEGVRVPLLATSSGQIEIQTPWDVATGTANVVVTVDGAMSNTVIANVQAVAPGIFAVTHADGSPVASGSPVKAGEIVVVYMTGLGAVGTDLASGAAAPTDSLVKTTLTPQVWLANVPMNVYFSGLTPGTVGLYQVNAYAPSALPPDATATLMLTTGGQVASTQIAIQ